jgi:iron complex transport system ATP-binding protein
MDLVRRATIERKLTTIVVLHDLNAAVRFADAVAVLSAGRLAAIGSAEATVTPALVQAVFGVAAEHVRLSDGRPHLAIMHSTVSKT